MDQDQFSEALVCLLSHIVDAKLTCSKSDGGSSVCDTDPQNKLEVSITKLARFFPNITSPY